MCFFCAITVILECQLCLFYYILLIRLQQQYKFETSLFNFYFLITKMYNRKKKIPERMSIQKNHISSHIRQSACLQQTAHFSLAQIVDH